MRVHVAARTSVAGSGIGGPFIRRPVPTGVVRARMFRLSIGMRMQKRHDERERDQERKNQRRHPDNRMALVAGCVLMNGVH